MTQSTSHSPLVSMASVAALGAYAPYSNFPVGSVVRTKDGRTFTGANIENVSFSMTMCAERVALFKALSEGIKPGEISEIVVFHAKKIITPCGACRQVMIELMAENSMVYLASQNQVEPVTLKALAPMQFASLD